MRSSPFLSHPVNSQPFQAPSAPVILRAFVASVFSQQSNLLRIEIFDLLIFLQPVYGNVGEIYHSLAVISWFPLHFMKAITEALYVLREMRKAFKKKKKTACLNY